jgi:hypothetical protein
MAYEVLEPRKDKDGNIINPDYRDVKFTDEETGISAIRQVRYFEDPELFKEVLEGQERGFKYKAKLGLIQEEQETISEDENIEDSAIDKN